RFFVSCKVPASCHASHGFAPVRFTILLCADFAVGKSTEIVRAPEVETFENRNKIATSPGVDGRDFAVDEQDRIPRKMEILGPLEVDSVKLRVASEKTARDIRRKSDALPTPGQQWIITPVVYKTGQNLALHSRTLCLLNRFRRESGNVVNVDVLQTVTQGRVQVCVDWFACLDRKSVIPVVIVRTQEVGLRKKQLTTQGQLAIEEIGFG